MKIIHTQKGLRSTLQMHRKSGEKLGFIPTMGALHDGHLSLIQRAKKECDIVICSIFVNPTQFNDPKDYDNYPKMPEKDKALIQNYCDYLYLPEYDDVYIKKELNDYSFNGIDSLMEGSQRPGHFNGVANVVQRLFEIVRPDFAFFGLKDFQQYLIIKKLVEQKSLPIKIVGCETVREQDGLAMSSRNLLLAPMDRQNASNIFKALQNLKIDKTKLSLENAKNNAIIFLTSIKGIDLEYLSVVDEDSLQEIENWEDSIVPRAFIAAKVGKVRLIDNLALK